MHTATACQRNYGSRCLGDKLDAQSLSWFALVHLELYDRFDAEAPQAVPLEQPDGEQAYFVRLALGLSKSAGRGPARRGAERDIEKGGSIFPFSGCPVASERDDDDLVRCNTGAAPHSFNT